MFSPAKAITAGAVVFSLGGVWLIAEPFDQQGRGVPGAETNAEPAAPVEVSGQHLAYDPNHGQDHAIQQWSMSDPRLDGTFKWYVHEGMDADSGHPIGFGVHAYVIENDEGTWRGIPDAGALLRSEDDFPPQDMIFEGEGAYEGLTFVARFFEDGNDYAMRGYIIDGDFALPPDFAVNE